MVIRRKGRNTPKLWQLSFELTGSDAQKDTFSAQFHTSQVAARKWPRALSPPQSYQNVSRETFWYDWGIVNRWLAGAH